MKRLQQLNRTKKGKAVNVCWRGGEERKRESVCACVCVCGGGGCLCVCLCMSVLVCLHQCFSCAQSQISASYNSMFPQNDVL